MPMTRFEANLLKVLAVVGTGLLGYLTYIFILVAWGG